MSAKLLCRTGPQAGLTFRVRDVARIGRGAGIEVDLPLQGVSSLHATIVFTSGSYWIEDAGSTNGTFVNGRRVMKERLRHLDVLSLGAGVDLLFVLKTVAAGEEQSVILGPTLDAARLV
ncbi:MAG: FHA domain-containing protein, partial [Thermoanaerobaculia bacterium]